MDYDYLYRIVLIGDSGTGKSNLLLRYTDNYFSENFISTIGVDFKINTMKLDDKMIKLQFWDTAGQERFDSITRNYYRGCDGIAVVYDITNMDSFNNISKWMNKIDELSDARVVRMLIGNKCDLDDKRQVTTEMGQDLATQYGVQFYETSAKARTNVDMVFESIARTIFRRTRTVKPVPNPAPPISPVNVIKYPQFCTGC